jgi:hypothetical protein
MILSGRIREDNERAMGGMLTLTPRGKQEASRIDR